MSQKIPKASATKVIKVIEKNGWKLEKPPKGSHAQFLREGDPDTLITVVLKKEIKRGTLQKIIAKKSEVTGESREKVIKDIKKA